MLMIIFFIIHLVIVSVMIGAYWRGHIHLNYFLLMVLMIFPFVGAFAVGLFNAERQKREQEPEEDFDTRFPWLTDDISLEDSRSKVSSINPDHIVPFQEALLINNMRIRRELIIDVIFESPDQYVGLLHQARLNEDVEVVHYATTILSELSAKYDSRLQALEEAVRDNPDDDELKIAYAQFLYKYIDSNIAEGHHARTLKTNYTETVQELMDKKLITNLDAYQHLARIYTELNQLDALKNHLDKMAQLFPQEEATWMARLEYIALKKSSSELRDFLQTIKEKNIYFSSKNRQRLAFWQQEFN